MRKVSWMVLSLCFVLSVLFLPAIVSAGNCSGEWRTLENYQQGTGGPCKAMGLNSRAGTCRPGEMYEILCDDRKGGQYRICKGPRRCVKNQRTDNQIRIPHDVRDQHNPDQGDPHQGIVIMGTGDQGDRDCHAWDFQYDRPCPKGFFNSDCQGDCERKDCRTWDFKYGQPCPAGFYNPDCQGDCEKR